MAADPLKNAWPIYVLIAGYLILRFVWAVAIPGGEWPLSPGHYLSMAVDVALLVGLIGSRRQLRFIALSEGRRSLARFLFVGGMISGVGLILIRFTSDSAWWTGHLR